MLGLLWLLAAAALTKVDAQPIKEAEGFLAAERSLTRAVLSEALAIENTSVLPDLLSKLGNIEKLFRSLIETQANWAELRKRGLAVPRLSSASSGGVFVEVLEEDDPAPTGTSPGTLPEARLVQQVHKQAKAVECAAGQLLSAQTEASKAWQQLAGAALRRSEVDSAAHMRKVLDANVEYHESSLSASHEQACNSSNRARRSSSRAKAKAEQAAREVQSFQRLLQNLQGSTGSRSKAVLQAERALNATRALKEQAENDAKEEERAYKDTLAKLDRFRRLRRSAGKEDMIRTAESSSSAESVPQALGQVSSDASHAPHNVKHFGDAGAAMSSTLKDAVPGRVDSELEPMPAPAPAPVQPAVATTTTTTTSKVDSQAASTPVPAQRVATTTATSTNEDATGDMPFQVLHGRPSPEVDAAAEAVLPPAASPAAVPRAAPAAVPRAAPAAVPAAGSTTSPCNDSDDGESTSAVTPPATTSAASSSTGGPTLSTLPASTTSIAPSESQEASTGSAWDQEAGTSSTTIVPVGSSWAPNGSEDMLSIAIGQTARLGQQVASQSERMAKTRERVRGLAKAMAAASSALQKLGASKDEHLQAVELLKTQLGTAEERLKKSRGTATIAIAAAHRLEHECRSADIIRQNYSEASNRSAEVETAWMRAQNVVKDEEDTADKQRLKLKASLLKLRNLTLSLNASTGMQHSSLQVEMLGPHSTLPLDDEKAHSMAPAHQPLRGLLLVAGFLIPKLEIVQQ